MSNKPDPLAELLNELFTWCHTYGASLKPPGPDTYGEGVRVSKQQVATIICKYCRRYEDA